MAAPVGLSGSVPEPRRPEATDSEPEAAHRATAESVPTDPEAAEPEGAEPEGAEPEAAEPEAAGPEAAEPEAAEPEAAEPEGAEPEGAEPEGAEPEGAELTNAEPATAEPVAAEPEAVEPAGQVGEQSTPAALDPHLEPAAAEPGQHMGETRKVRPLAIVGLVFGIIALVGVAVAVLAIVTHNFRPKTVVTYRPAAVYSLQVGTCINTSPNGLSVTVLSCAAPHDAEVFATFSLTGSSWPGDAVVQQEAGSGCMSRLAAYLNPELAGAGFAEEYIYPDQAAWQAGLRTVICEVRASSGQLTGSVRNGG